MADSDLAVKEKTTKFCDLAKALGYASESSWGLIYTNLAYNNAQIRWYIDNLILDVCYNRDAVVNNLMEENLSKADAGFVAGAFKRLCDTPLGTVLHFGKTAVKGSKLLSLTRTKCAVHDDRVVLYALYRYAKACGDYYEFNLSRLTDTTIQSAGISPVKLFGFAEDELTAILRGLSPKYPDFINATFTHGLNKITLREDKDADAVLDLFRQGKG